jgi:hypothetical protein
MCVAWLGGRILVVCMSGHDKLVHCRLLFFYFFEDRPKVIVVPKESVCDNFYRTPSLRLDLSTQELAKASAKTSWDDGRWHEPFVAGSGTSSCA